MVFFVLENVYVNNKEVRCTDYFWEISEKYEGISPEWVCAYDDVFFDPGNRLR